MTFLPVSFKHSFAIAKLSQRVRIAKDSVDIEFYSEGCGDMPP